MTHVGEFPRVCLPFCNPSTSGYSFESPVNKRSMKRRSEFMEEDGNVPHSKRPYEERMSSRLDNFHINDNVDAAGMRIVEELQDWIVDDCLDAAESSNCIVDEPGGGVEHSGGIVLSGQLRSYIDACKKHDDLAFLKKSQPCKELVLYREPNTNTGSAIDEDDIRNRIVEVADWIETDDEPTGEGQYVTFPIGSTSHSSPDSASPRSASPDAHIVVGDSGVSSLDSYGYAQAGSAPGDDDAAMEID